MEYKKFNPLNVSSKFAICGLPLRVDTYKTCSFQCKYCFSNHRKIMEFEKELQIANLKWLENKLNKVYVKKNINKKDFLEMLLEQKITWHCGGMSDPFQPIEEKLQITKQMVDISNKHECSILFSTKTDNLYGCNIRNDLHSFQFSITNLDNRKDIEPNVPDINKRYKLYRNLKSDGFKVGIRVQPFIPNVTSTDIIEMFHDADYFTIEGLKLIPQDKEQINYFLDLLNMSRDKFKLMGLLNLLPEYRLELYKDFIHKLEELNIPYSIADNDLHYMTKSKCCCGEPLIKKSTDWNTTAMLYKYGLEYELDDVKNECGDCFDCKCRQIFPSTRQGDNVTVEDFYNDRFGKKTSPFSKKFLYIGGK